MTLKPVDYQKRLLIGTPLVGWKCDRFEDIHWLENAETILERFPNCSFFAALELDHRGLEPFTRVLERLAAVNGSHWTYTINDNQTVVTSENRWIRIETGRNLVREYAQRGRADAILYVDSDTELTPEIIEKLLEVDRPLVGVNVPEYVQHGPVVHENPRIEEHWTTAGMLLVNAPAYYDLPWFHNEDLQLSDDPSFQRLAEKLFGMTWVRKDINAHHKGQLIAVEHRRIPERVIEHQG